MSFPGLGSNTAAADSYENGSCDARCGFVLDDSTDHAGPDASSRCGASWHVRDRPGRDSSIHDLTDTSQRFSRREQSSCWNSRPVTARFNCGLNDSTDHAAEDAPHDAEHRGTCRDRPGRDSSIHDLTDTSQRFSRREQSSCWNSRPVTVRIKCGLNDSMDHAAEDTPHDAEHRGTCATVPVAKPAARTSADCLAVPTDEAACRRPVNLWNLVSPSALLDRRRVRR